MVGNSVYDAIMEWIKANAITIIVSAFVPILIQLFQFRKIRSEADKLTREGGKLEREAESIAVDSANKALGVWETVVSNIRQQSDKCVEENVVLRGRLTELSDEIERMQKQQSILLATVQSIIKIFSEVKPDTVLLLDSRGAVKYVSLNIVELLGYDVKEFVDKSIYEVFHPDDRTQTTVVLNQLLLTSHMTLANRFRFRARNGQYKWVEVVGTNLLDNERINGILLSLRDITDRKNIEEMFKQTYSPTSILSTVTGDVTEKKE